MRRRDFITLLGGAAAAWPVAARAQQSAMPVVGFLYTGVPELSAPIVAAFRSGLNEAGYIEGRNVAIEYRFAHNDNARLPELAADLVRRHVAVIAAPAAAGSALAAKAATTTIPIVFSTGVDPVQIGLVASFNRPDGNVTGVVSMNVELGAKRLGILHELMPEAARFAVLVNPNTSAVTKPMIADLQAAASAIGRQIEVFNAVSNSEIDSAFANLAQTQAAAVLITPGYLFDNRRVQLVALAAHYRMPAIYPFRENVEIGGLMSYGSSAADRDRQAGLYAGRILKGEKPSDLPIMRASKFELVINLQTARILGLTVPPTLLAIADEVIE
jgi:putative ABC transport system substrate-binding protein